MTTERFVSLSLGIDGEVIDKLCEEFNIDFSEDDFIECVKNGINRHWGVAEELLMLVFHNIIEQYPELDEDKFDYDFSSPSFPDFYYNEERFSTKEDLDKIAGREDC